MMEQVRRIVPEIVKKPPAVRFTKLMAITQLRPRVLIASPNEREQLKTEAAKEVISARRAEEEQFKAIFGRTPREMLEEHIKGQTRIYRIFEEYKKKERAEPVMAEVITPKEGLPAILVQLPRPLKRAIEELEEEIAKQRRTAIPAELRSEWRALVNMRARLERKRDKVVALASSYGLSDRPEVAMALRQADARLTELNDRIARKEEQIRRMEERQREKMAVI
jgi:uncharacterized coiled-coil protein SlyX